MSPDLNNVYPRVLIIALGRINLKDNFNNGLLMRNLFLQWPKSNLAQIFSSGDNGDEGFCGSYFMLRNKERRLGWLFHYLKAKRNDIENKEINSLLENKEKSTSFLLKYKIRGFIETLFFRSGLYEILFKPKLSGELAYWIDKFNPHFIFAQGYSLTFIRLPLLIKNRTKAKLAFLTSDDWPSYLYTGMLGDCRCISWIARNHVVKATNVLFSEIDLPFAFGHPMAIEYEKRYNKKFTIITHCDNPNRFLKAKPIRIHKNDIISIVTIGNFNMYRWPLILDLDKACNLLNENSWNVRIAILSNDFDPEGYLKLKECKHVDLIDNPGNDLLPTYLKGADILFLAEGFDDKFVKAIQFSISSKSHLFMFSRKPILVYAHKDTGVAKYATKYHWAQVISKRDVYLLADAVKKIITNKEFSNKLAEEGFKCSMEYHSSIRINELFLNSFLSSFK